MSATSIPTPDRVCVIYADVPLESVLADLGISLPRTPTLRLPDGSNYRFYALSETEPQPTEFFIKGFALVIAEKGDPFYERAFEESHWDLSPIDTPFAIAPPLFVERMCASIEASKGLLP